MAVIDPASDAVVIRVAYDGPPMAGKTTSVRALARGLGGNVVAPEEVGGRTLYFDWLDYTGGLFEGRRIRCQIVSVPGQATLASRRRRLLESADAVVFVGDSSPEEQGATQSYLDGLRSVLEKTDGPPIGIVLQANKRDRPAAVGLDSIRAMLDRIGGRISVIESIATDGSGIREAFVFAVRLALDRVRELMRTGRLRTERPEVDNADELLAQLQAGDGSALRLAAESGLIHTRMHDLRGAPAAVQALEQALRDNSGVATPALGTSQPAMVRAQPGIAAASVERGAVASAAEVPAAPDGDLPSGMIWPPVHGRQMLHAATAAAVSLKQSSSGDWVATSGNWQLQSPVGGCFAKIEQGHAVLVNWARMHAASADVISTERCIALCKDGRGQFRLWQVVRIERSLRDQFDSELGKGPDSIAKGLLALTRGFLLASERLTRAACWLPLNLRTIGATPGEACYLGQMPDPRRSRPVEPRLFGATLKLLSSQLGYALGELQANRVEALAALDEIIRSRPQMPYDPTQGFVRRFLDAVSV